MFISIFDLAGLGDHPEAAPCVNIIYGVIWAHLMWHSFIDLNFLKTLHLNLNVTENLDSSAGRTRGGSGAGLAF